MTLWQSCEGEKHIGPLRGLLYRLVESQEHIATLGYVDTLEEQALLEEMLESAKPSYTMGSENYHYLLKTPFRYPPLKWGSRFGRLHEPSIFYGGGDPEVALAESAYYRFVFWYSMEAPPVKNKIRTEHTLFSVGYYTEKGVQLQKAPFNAYLTELRHPKNYHACQLTGSAMREAGVDAFEYLSARDQLQGICIGLFTHKAFAHKRPQTMSQWLCEITAQEVLFKQHGASNIMNYPITDFLLENELPMPA